MSIHKIAKLSGFSPATVSKVINSRPGISKKTEEFIKKTMKEAGYIPRPPESRPGPRLKPDFGKTASSAFIKNKAFAFIPVGIYKSQMNSPIYTQVMQGVEAELTKRGFVMILSWLSEKGNIPPFLKNHEVDGVCLFGKPDYLSKELQVLLRSFYMVSLLGNSSPFCDHVTYDDQKVGHLAADYLIKRGRKNLAYLGNCDNSLLMNRGMYFKHFCEMMGQNVTMIEGSLIKTDEETNQVDHLALEKCVEKILNTSPVPTGIFIAGDILAVPLYSILIEKGITPGKDMDIVSVNNEFTHLQGLRPRPATVDIRAFQIGQVAIQRILWRAEHPEENRVTIVLDPELIP